MAPRSSPVLSIVIGILCAGLIQLTSASRPSPRDAPPSQRTLISSNTDSLANSLLASLNASGLAVAVVRQDSSVPGGWRREFGSYGIAKDDGAPVTPDTLFAIASNSKLFLAYSVGLLVSNKTLAQMRGKDLTWTTKAKDIFPEWGLMDDTASQETDIRDMLSHRIGLPSHLYALGRGSAGRAEVIANLKFLRPSAEFRQIFQYHNPGYETLARTPEVLLNQSYESYIAQHLFKPLNMSSSTFSVKEAEASGKLADGFHLDMRDQVKGVNGTRTAIIPFFARNGTERSWAGAGGVISSARDLSIWVSMLLNKGRHPETNQTVVPEEVVERCASGMTIFSAKPMYPEMVCRTVRFQVPLESLIEPKSPLVYGHAQTRYSYRGHEVIEHGGGLPGFISQVTRFPNDNLAIVTLTNDYNAVTLTDAVKWRIVDENLGLPEIDWSKRYTSTFIKIRASDASLL
ncbi:hypothetical protein AMATHDRAFT_142013 [Amanita thiersii Skay4041]|uniref:Beta-lactamase-related domain-containing protein n=1 Tax=Amanita thiersii Skay4041 TaxID=703135 RepID=A0A2A9NVC5_9AGAR|nr:hypothetical protein AMATHDRAFT_142013 [Amanita thiersii Skay4041]